MTTIAREHSRRLGVPLEASTLQYLNRIENPDVLRQGQRLRIPVDPIRVVVFKRSFLLAIYVGDRILRTTWCAHGKAGCETPETTFRLIEKTAEPDWPRPEGGLVPYGHPDNPLGTHFLKLEHSERHGFGIHGTWRPESIGTRASLGCVRVPNDEIAELYQLLPRGALVEVRP